VAGDFNLATSRFTIEEAVRKKEISAETAKTIDGLEVMLEEKGLLDAWAVAGGASEEDVYDGEEGATFDPTKNPLAAETVRNAGSTNMRPRRYDRIFVKGDELFEVVDFNMFGLAEDHGSHLGVGKGKDREVEPRYGSDHWGVRATLGISSVSAAEVEQSHGIEAQLPSLQLRKAPSSLSDPAILLTCLTSHSTFPSEAEIHHRKQIIDLLDNILQGNHSQLPTSSTTSRLNPSIILLPVGSYAIDIWTPSSDLDILCISTISPSSFFSLARRRLKNFSNLGIKILRQVDAASGMMLELEVSGVRCDLQYCCAPGIVTRFVPSIFYSPHSLRDNMNVTATQ
jgi:hypothetical protein